MDENAFDVTIVGTALPESILAAALSKAGLRVLHIDREANYGSTDASLTLIDLHHLIMSPPAELADISVPVPIPEALLRDSRNFSISLGPSVVPSVGPLIDSLINSGVSRYVKFKLLDGVGLYALSGAGDAEDGRPESVGSVKTVPGSKEDVFKSKELGLLQKRRLMKFLMNTASQTDTTFGNGSKSTDDNSLLAYLTSKDIGLDVEVANAVVYALSLSVDPNEPIGSAIKRLRKYIRSTGRHGNSPFLVGHFGGAGEIAQGFCRAAAVAGATYILGRPFSITKITENSQGSEFQLSFEGIDDVLTSCILVSRKSGISLSSSDGYSNSTKGDTPSKRRLARCIAILDGPVYFSKPTSDENALEEIENNDEEDNINGIVDSAILIFPPGSLFPSAEATTSDGDLGVVTGFIAGPNALVCPDGKRIVYLSAEIRPGRSPEGALQPYLSAIQNLNRPANDPAQILTSLFYSQPIPSSRSSPRRSTPPPNAAHASPEEESKGPFNTDGLVTLYPPSCHLAELGDEAAEEAERVFWEVMNRMDLDGRVEERGRHDHEPDADKAGLKRGDAERGEPRERDVAGGDEGQSDKVTEMWPKQAIDEGVEGG